ncbi:unnamed protein product [Caenorhabditis auriculariae]|uniref:Peptide-N(4)-(N-acetyl-beta-glucosaminyl)asparagine amidase n=1 Tax=Caenorhabditis auriculariae TaxID=2777116 RepID=A0A8S1H3L0_9PELO|nr:unnamed protein product [Caenorhabditis auriculariae]
MPVRTVSSLGELQSKINSADENHILVLDFYADWCGPCRMIAPDFEQFSDFYQNATFIKINVDHHRDISSGYQVRAMPTFVIVKSRREVARMQGAGRERLRSFIDQHYSNVPVNPFAATPEEKKFLEKLVSYTKQTAFYGDVIYQTLARSVIPEDKLTELATVDSQVNQFALAKELLSWFKNDFFTWCDSPICSCGEQTPKDKGMDGRPTTEELRLGANRVEVYECPKCSAEVRYPRYNDPAKLLETKKGRCGEWANCFTLIAAAMGFDVRLILDTTDHVWTELWIEDEKRWVHCDPCENIIDCPLIYEKGWGKKLQYVIGYGIDHIYDVTWRYVVDSRKTFDLRRDVRPETFSSFLTKLNARQLSNITAERKKEVITRRMYDLVEMVSAESSKRQADNKAYSGRTTGDEAWRRSRGEMGRKLVSGTSVVSENSEPIQLNQQELEAKKFRLQYSCIKDEYERVGTHKTTLGYSTLATSVKNIARKVESDWKKSYLCRSDGAQEGEITWSVDLREVKEIKSIRLKFDGISQFESGKVIVVVCVADSCTKVPKSGELTLEEIKPDVVKITAKLLGGDGNNAFQHAQLFRCDSDALNDYQFVLDIDFN